MSAEVSVEDRLAIERLYADYAWALDTGDVDAVMKTFWPGAAMQDPLGRFGPDEEHDVRVFFERIAARPDFAGRQHWVSQLRLRAVEGGVIGDSYVFVPASYRGGGVNIHLAAFYRDRIECIDGEWRFRERLVGPRYPEDVA